MSTTAFLDFGWSIFITCCRGEYIKPVTFHTVIELIHNNHEGEEIKLYTDNEFSIEKSKIFGHHFRASLLKFNNLL